MSLTKQERETLEDALDLIQQVADQRVERLLRDWRKRYPKARLTITFGMGTEYIEVNGEQVEPLGSWDVEKRPRMMKLLRDMINDLDEITNGYRLAAPSENVDSNLITVPIVGCSLCGLRTEAKLAHLHRGRWIGDCCWDERLKVSE